MTPSTTTTFELTRHAVYLATEDKTSDIIDEMMNVHKKEPAIDISKAEAQIDPFKHHILRNIYLQLLLFNSVSFREFVRTLPPNALEYCYCNPPDSELGLDMLVDDLANPDAHEHLTKGGNLFGLALSYARQSFARGSHYTTLVVIDCGSSNMAFLIEPQRNAFGEYVLLVIIDGAFPKFALTLAQALTNDRVKRVILMVGSREKMNKPGDRGPVRIQEAMDPVGSYLVQTKVDRFHVTSVIIVSTSLGRKTEYI